MAPKYGWLFGGKKAALAPEELHKAEEKHEKTVSRVVGKVKRAEERVRVGTEIGHHKTHEVVERIRTAEKERTKVDHVNRDKMEEHLKSLALRSMPSFELGLELNVALPSNSKAKMMT